MSFLVGAARFGRGAVERGASDGAAARRLPPNVRGGWLGRALGPTRAPRHAAPEIEAAGAGFRSLTESIDTTTPAGRMLMQMVGSFAEFERAMIRERTSAGLAQARAEGRVGGRRRKLTTKQRAEIAESVLSGRKSAAEMARLYDVSQPTVSRIVAQARASL